MGSTTDVFLNRCIVCCLAICLLWLTSLQLCIVVVDLNIHTTTLGSVVDSCTYSFDVVQRENEAYSLCVQQQLITCNNVLTVSAIAETTRVETTQSQNTYIVRTNQQKQSNCSMILTAATNALKAWSALGLEYTIPYRNCSTDQRIAVITLLGDTSSTARSNAYASSVQYSQSSDTTTTRLSQYEQNVIAYNVAYMKNKTQILQSSSNTLIDKLSEPYLARINARFSNLEATVDGLLACLSLVDDSSAATVTAKVRCPYPTNLLEEYKSLRMYINTTLDSVHLYFAEVNDELLTVSAGISTAVGKANAFYNSVKGAQGVLAWAQTNLGVNLCGVTQPDFCSFSTNDWFIPHPLVPSLPFLAFMPDGSALWDQVKAAPLQVKASIVNTSAATNNDVAALIAATKVSMGQLPAKALNDYHPPAYPYATNVSSEVAIQKHKSQTFLASLMSQLGAVGSFTTSTTTASATRAVQNASHAALNGGVDLISSFGVQWATLSPFSGFSLTGWLASIATLRGALFLFDYLFRAVHTVRLIHQFTKPSLVDLPVVDLGPSKKHSAGEHFRQIAWAGLVRCQTALQLLPFVYLQILMLLAFFAFCVWLITALYLPAYDLYASGCVHHAANDSLLSAQVTAFAFNYAAADGNAALASGMQDYNARVADYCAAHGEPSVQDYGSSTQAMVSVNQSRQANWNQFQLLSACVNLTAVDEWFASACCGHGQGLYGSTSYREFYGANYAVPLETLCTTATAGTSQLAKKCPLDSNSGLPYLPPGLHLQTVPTYASAASVQFDGSQLVDSRFQCQSLPTCQITCLSPDLSVVHAVMKSCSCMGEWMVHGDIFNAALALCVYLVLNVSRILIMRGFVRMFWRAMCPTADQEFDVRLVALENGKIVSAAVGLEGSDVTVDNTDSGEKRPANAKYRTDLNDVDFDKRKDSCDEENEDTEACSGERGLQRTHSVIAGAIAAMLRRVIWTGRLYVVLGFACNALWITLLIYARKNIAYNP